MKSPVISSVLIVLVIIFISANAIFISLTLDGFANDLSICETDENALSRIYEDFKGKELLLSLTLTDDETDELDGRFAECIKLVRLNDVDAAEKEKSRLINRLLQIKRLSGFNLSSIL